MKRNPCRAITTSSNQQCSKKALIGASYCWIHYPKRTPLIILFIGAIIGLFLQIGYDNFTTSEEEERLSELSSKFDGFVEFAAKLYPNLEEKKAIEKFKEEFESLKSEYLTEKNTIKNLSSSIEVKFSGKWSKSPGSIIPISPADRQWYLILINPENGNEIKFYGTQMYSFEDLSPNLSIFKSRQAARPGNFPISEQIEVLNNYKKMRIFIPFIFRQNNIGNREITLEEVNITLFVNNSIKKQHVRKPQASFVIPINEKGWAIFDLSVENLL